MTKIVLNGREVEVDGGRPLIDACNGNGCEVPTYCYHPGLSPVGSCRICQVEVKQGEMPPRVVVACRTPVVEGMVVDTEAPKAHSTRRECLEFLLKNHPLDCPICDKAGECTLQDYAFAENQGEGRTSEPRRKLAKRKSLGDVIVLDEERCILCSRCVRFFEEVPKQPQLTVSDLGARSVISTFADRPLHGNYQGNIADLCPVGALTLKRFRFQARVWNLRKRASTCGECSRGCAITVEVLRAGDVKRIRPRYEPAVNGWWMCDVGRFSFESTEGVERLRGAELRGASGLDPAEVDDALEAARDMLATNERRALVASPWITVEEGQALLALGERLGAEPVFVSPAPNDLADDVLHTGDPCPNRRGLEQLGVEGISAEEARERIAGAEVALLVGERVCDLLGREELAALPATLRVLVLDERRLDAPAVDLCIGVPQWVERSGHWINADGHRGPIAAARPAPPGVRATTALLSSLTELLTATEVES